MRKTWKDARDKAKVPQGVVRSVSMGDSIDDFYKKSQAGLKPLIQGGEALKKTLGTYVAGVEKKYPDWVKWIKANIEKDLTDALSRARRDEQKLLALQTAIDQGASPGDIEGPRNLLLTLESTKPWDEASKDLMALLAGAISSWEGLVGKIDALKLEVKLASKEEDAKKVFCADSWRFHLGTLNKIAQTKTKEDFMQQSKYAQEISQDVNCSMNGMEAGIKALLG
jgi:hypothetical protein